MYDIGQPPLIIWVVLLFVFGFIAMFDGIIDPNGQFHINSILLWLYFVHKCYGTAYEVMTRLVSDKCIAAGVGETGDPRGKPTIKLLY